MMAPGIICTLHVLKDSPLLNPVGVHISLQDLAPHRGDKHVDINIGGAYQTYKVGSHLTHE